MLYFEDLFSRFISALLRFLVYFALALGACAYIGRLVWWCAVVYGGVWAYDLWRCAVVYGGVWVCSCMVVCGGVWWNAVVYGGV
jgi:hypothetical protein